MVTTCTSILTTKGLISSLTTTTIPRCHCTLATKPRADDDDISGGVVNDLYEAWSLRQTDIVDGGNEEREREKKNIRCVRFSGL